jgi:hypothetical protein
MSESLSKSGNLRNGLTFGLIIGLVYCLSLFARYNASSNPIIFGVITFLFYLGVIGMLFFCVAKRRKELGGYIDLKDAFQTVFIAILIAELIYSVFNLVYLKVIDPNFFDRWQANMEEFIEKSVKDDTKREETLDDFKAQMDKQRERGLTASGIALGYLISVAITGIFGLIVSLIMKKRRSVFDQLDQTRA